MELTELHRELIERPSDKSIVEIQQFIRSFLTEPDSIRVTETGAIIASKGTGRPHYVLNTHFDTVPPHIPYERDGKYIYGRGACDAKGPLAVFLSVFEQIDITGKLTLVLTPDEETSTESAKQFSESFTEDVDGFIIGEPTGLDICTTGKGYFEGKISITGEAAHSSTPQKGENAITAAGEILNVMQTYDEQMGNSQHPQLGNPVLEPTIIEGGNAINQIPNECIIHFSRRGIPPETKTEFYTQFTNYLTERVSSKYSFNIEERGVPFLAPFETDMDSTLVQSFRTKTNGSVRAFTAATEASHFASFNAPIVIFGPGYISDETGPVAHSSREYVTTTQLRQAEEILQNVLTNLY